MRTDRLARLEKLGLLNDQWETAPLVGKWETVAHKPWEAACMEVYAAMVYRMDRGIGQIVEQLRQEKCLDNTLVFYLQDNGGCAEVMGRRGTKLHPEEPRAAAPILPPMAADALLPAGSVPPQTRDGYPVLMGTKVMPGPGDTYIGYGQGWANVSNTPFREYKHWVHEGGISTPLIVHWPQGIARKRRNKLESAPGHLIDIMATCIVVAGAKHPAGGEIKPVEGVSLRPAFEGNRLERREPIFWEHEGNRAVREGKWKLAAKEKQPWELYDMEADRTEMHDLASAEPDKVRELAARWDGWASRASVLPLGAWREKVQSTESAE